MGGNHRSNNNGKGHPEDQDPLRVPHHLVLVAVDVVGVGDEVVPNAPFLAVLQVLVEPTRKNGFVFQGDLECPSTYGHGVKGSQTTTKTRKKAILLDIR